MKIRGTQKNVEIEVTEQELAYAIMQVVVGKVKVTDDAGCDWCTDKNRTYIGNDAWLVSEQENIARLVDAANILLNGKILRF